MPYLDEEILRQRQESYKEKYRDIYGEKVYVGGEYLTFSEQTLFDGRMRLWLPDRFDDMPEEIAKIKYPMEQRPQIIKTSDDSIVNFSFNLFDQAFKDSQIGEAAGTFQLVVKKLHPSSSMFEKHIEPLEELRLGWFDFKTTSIDAPVYTIMAVTVIDGRLLHAVFSCLHENMDDWKPVALQVLRSIRNTGHIEMEWFE